MTGHYFLSLDCGLTATKAAVFDGGGRQIASASEDTGVLEKGERSEIDMEGQWARSCAVIRSAIARFGLPASRISGIGVSGHGAGLYPVDSKGKAICPAFTSMDSRADGIVRAWSVEGPDLYPKTRHSPWSGQSLPQLRWLKDNRPEDYQRIRWIFTAKDWIVFNLTGEAVTDPTDLSNNAAVDIASGAYDRGIMEAYGIGECADKIPNMVPSASIVGTVQQGAALDTGLAPGIPVVAGMFDVIASAVGSGALGEKAFSMISGTWNINTAFDRRLLDTPRTVKVSLSPIPGLYAYVESSATSAANLAWFLGTVDAISGSARRSTHSMREEQYALINEGVARIAPGSAGLTYLPFIHRSHLAPGTDAAFVGMKAEHSGFHLLRALYEGVAFAHRRHLDILSSGGIERTRVLLCGGAANSDVWCGIFADALGRTIETSDAEQAGARGIAIAVAVGIGIYSSFEEASRSMIGAGKRYDPDPARRAVMDACYKRFIDTAERLGKTDS
jgi:L-xylulokinase